MENRLELIDYDLSEKIKNASSEKQRSISLAVTRYAIMESNLISNLVGQAYEAVRTGRINDKELKDQIEHLVQDLDQKQWDLHDLVDEGEASEEEYLKAFKRARAANALFFLLDADPVISALESSYEAHAVSGSIEDLRSVIFREMEVE
jgi:hypothetical protein